MPMKEWHKLNCQDTRFQRFKIFTGEYCGPNTANNGYCKDSNCFQVKLGGYI